MKQGISQWKNALASLLKIYSPFCKANNYPTTINRHSCMRGGFVIKIAMR
jgi:hypothetical protein